MSCGSPIPPEFKAAIQNNICPSCGGELMNDATLEMLHELKEALKKMPNDPEGIAGWLLSHYEMRKVGTGEAVGQFYGLAASAPPNPMLRQQTNILDKESELRANPKQAPNKLQMFYNNIGKNNPKTKDHYNQIAQQINNGEVDSDYGAQQNQYPMQPKAVNPVVAQQLALADGQYGEYPPHQPKIPYGHGYGDYDSSYDQSDYVEEAIDPAFTQQALSAMNGMERPMSRDDMRAMQQKMSESGSVYDIEMNNGPQHPGLQAQRMDRIRKQQELSEMGSVGKISRSV